MKRSFMAYVEYDEATDLYVGTVPGLPGAHSPGKTLDELQRNVQEVIELIIEEYESRGEQVEVVPFVGIQHITVER